MISKRITIEGVDKTGKDLLVQYIVRMSNHKYVIQSRGIMSQMAYTQIYNRNYEYDLAPYKHDVIFYLKGDIDDLAIRHKITGEPPINIQKDMAVFDDVAVLLRNNGIDVIELDTSSATPYQNAKKILKYMEQYE